MGRRADYVGPTVQEVINRSSCGISRVQPGKTVLFATPILHYPPLGGPALRIDSSIKALSRVSKVYVYCRTSLASIGGPEAQKFYERYAQKCYFAPFEFPGSWHVRFAKRVSNNAKDIYTTNEGLAHTSSEDTKLGPKRVLYVLLDYPFILSSDTEEQATRH
jgi:hypothetical protein